MIEIKNRFTGRTIATVESLIDADLRSANLYSANLRSANLRSADLRGANLCGANLGSANLGSANLGSANLYGANLRSADLRSANLYDANLRSADLRGANLCGATLRSADLRSADLCGADLYNVKPGTSIAKITITHEGEMIGWKKCNHNVLVKLRVPPEARRSNATGRKCRAEFVEVLEVIGANEGVTDYHGPRTVYRVGETVHCDKWDDERFNECSGGIHFFITREEAEAW